MLAALSKWRALEGELPCSVRRRSLLTLLANMTYNGRKRRFYQSFSCRSTAHSALTPWLQLMIRSCRGLSFEESHFPSMVGHR